MLCIENGTILTPFQTIPTSTVVLDGEKISAVSPRGERFGTSPSDILDATGLYVVPGFIDLQINGGFGLDFTHDPQTIWEVGSRLPCYGVTSFLPTIITSPFATIQAAQTAWMQGPPPGYSGAKPLGLHLEGPFLNPGKKGAHNPAFIQLPDLARCVGWYPQAGVRLVTLAPEQPGALALIRQLTDRKVLVSAGHSLASYDEAQAGFEAGIRYGTHIFNAMPPIDHRRPGLVGALLENEDLVAGAIVDWIHVHPALIKMLWKTLGPNRLNLVTDAMAALGIPPGKSRIGDFHVRVDDNSVRLADGTLAGSILSSDQALRNLMKITGCPLELALQTITSTPARLLDEPIGQIAPGYRADLTLLDQNYQVRMTIAAGQIVYQNGAVH